MSETKNDTEARASTEEKLAREFADWEKRVESEPTYDRVTLEAIHDFFEFTAETDTDMDGWLHAHIKKARRAPTEQRERGGGSEQMEAHRQSIFVKASEWDAVQTRLAEVSAQLENAVEFGYRQCEDGRNLEHALAEFKRVAAEEDNHQLIYWTPEALRERAAREKKGKVSI